MHFALLLLGIYLKRFLTSYLRYARTEVHKVHGGKNITTEYTEEEEDGPHINFALCYGGAVADALNAIRYVPV